MAFKLNLIKKLLLDLVFPTQCLGCGQEGLFLCSGCAKIISQFNFPICPICQRRLSKDGDIRCQTQSHRNPLSFVIAAASYETLLTQRIVSALKYQKISSFAKPLSEILSALLNNFEWKDFWLVPVPLHPAKLRQRGFNQSEILARCISNQTNIPLANVLEKKKNTPPQVGMASQGRLKNQINAFACSNPIQAKGKNILLVDDVFTTGATLTECARVLKLAGAKTIGAVVIAR